MASIVKWIITIVITLLFQLLSAQDITGAWNGVLSVQGTELPVILTVQEKEDSYSATLKSPKQSDQEIPADKTVFTNGKLMIEINALAVKYEGSIEEGRIKGTFTQAGNSLPLDLSKDAISITSQVSKKRLQDPIAPFSYDVEEVVFKNKKANGIKLSGTLTLPKNVKNPTVVILISGSGPQNRNEEILGTDHKPFLVLSDFLTKKGIAVLRYDERGVAKSEGKFKGATSLDFASDVEAAIDFLKKRKDIDTRKIGLIGHSEGGFIAPIVASENNDVAFIVLLAGTGVDGGQVLLTQVKKGAELANTPKNFIEINNNLYESVLSAIYEEDDKDIMLEKSKKNLTTYYNTLDEGMKAIIPLEKLETGLLELAKDPWFRYFIKTDPLQYLSKVKIPVLAINGSKDSQVLSELNLTGIKNGLIKAGNSDYTIKEIEGLNHLFQKAETGAISEYAVIEETFNPEAMKLVSDWILKRF
ncbi:alpha/beta hydrolase family protein [Aquimarina sp. 2201CG5-10]|uniref:alpha/beta hydrolase family protein n=1 Tax=Aquimarina callyspongiae TaxID=3098150 RepID=UPI002AB5B9E1|nr:CocE/NonD family hydrolase [Aquimarina sp. 2201CG5-10]MDY8134298.1 alpha/beta hydrolase [Aquimarina sp. 2201CG5-10]